MKQKLKTKKAAAKRFTLKKKKVFVGSTGKREIRFTVAMSQSGRRHNMRKRTRRMLRNSKGTVYTNVPGIVARVKRLLPWSR